MANTKKIMKKTNEITHKTKMTEIFKLNQTETKAIIKQMQAYGLETIGYGYCYNHPLEEYAQKQGISKQQFKAMLKSINKKL